MISIFTKMFNRWSLIGLNPSNSNVQNTLQKTLGDFKVNKIFK